MTVATTPLPRGPIPGLFNRQTINLIIGSSRCGKSHLMFNQLNEYAEGRGFLTFGLEPDAPPPVQMGLIMCIQTAQKAQRLAGKFSSLHDFTKFPIVKMKRRHAEDPADGFLRAYEELVKLRPVKFLIVEGLYTLVPDSKKFDTGAVQDLFEKLNEICERDNITILGTGLSAKQRRGEIYDNLADRIYGSVAWGQEIDMLILLEKQEMNPRPDVVYSRRRIKMEDHDSTARVFLADFGRDGKLCLVDETGLTPGDQQILKNEDRLDIWMNNAIEPGGLFLRPTVAEWAETNGISTGSLGSWLSSRQEMGFIEKVDNSRPATFRRMHTQ